ncbi:MAG: DNA adenine methylase [Pyrinomonadaceae bacterium]
MKRNTDYQPPFPYFGGSSPIAGHVWAALGDPLNYVEPFAGSLAVLFLRPGGAGHIETVNDADGFVSNFWRAIRADSDGVAEYADELVDECTLHARHLWLIGQRESLTDRLCGDDEFYDVKAAGYWAWGLCCWIGSGWCSGKGPWTSEGGEMVLRNPGQGVNRKLPHLRDPGKGDDTATPALGQPRPGRQPETPSECVERREWLCGYLRTFADRLRGVRVCCGDWSRVCGPSVTFRHGMTGVFLDPPYADTAKRTSDLYAVDCQQVAHAAREWAIEQGKNKLMRIVLKGYAGEHVMPDDWRVIEWQAIGGYALQGEEGSDGRENRKKERLWLSPACRKTMRQREIFA